jgi:hypothetical protein
MPDNTTTEIVEVESLVIATKTNREGADFDVLNITTKDGRVFGSTKPWIIDEGRKCVDCKFVVLTWHEKPGRYKDLLIDAVRMPDGEELRDIARETAPQAADEPASVAPGPSSWANQTADTRRVALELAVRFFEIRGPLTNGDRPFTGLSVEEILVLADRFRLYLEGEPRAMTPADVDPEDDLPDFFVTAAAPEEWS